MKKTLRWAPVLVLVALAAALAQTPEDEPPVVTSSGPSTASSQWDVRLPSGKLQRDEIAKAEHEANVKDASKLADMAQDLKESIEKDDKYVLSLTTLKKAEEIEKLARKIRARMRHD